MKKKQFIFSVDSHQDDSFTHVKKRQLMDNFAEDLLNLEGYGAANS